MGNKGDVGYAIISFSETYDACAFWVKLIVKRILFLKEFDIAFAYKFL